MHSRLTRLGGIKGGGRCSRPFCILEFKLQTSKMATVPAFEGLLGSSAPAGCDHQRSPPCLPACLPSRCRALRTVHAQCREHFEPAGLPAAAISSLQTPSAHKGGSLP